MEAEQTGSILPCSGGEGRRPGTGGAVRLDR